MVSKRSLTGAVAALAVSAAMAGGLSAQSFAASTTEDPAALEAKAEQYLPDRGKWNQAAELYRQAAALRPAGDALAIADLKSAARLAFYRGKDRQAIRDLEKAGQRALDIGDVVAAANAFADAAWIAGKDGNGARAKALMERAQLLALSPLISPTDRAELESRFETGPQ